MHTLLLAAFAGAPELAVPSQYIRVKNPRAKSKSDRFISFHDPVQVKDHRDGRTASICGGHHGRARCVVCMKVEQLDGWNFDIILQEVIWD